MLAPGDAEAEAHARAEPEVFGVLRAVWRLGGFVDSSMRAGGESCADVGVRKA